MKWWKLMLCAVMFAPMAALVGCEADADVDDDGASLKVDVDD